jgi:hypothetical protein
LVIASLVVWSGCKFVSEKPPTASEDPGLAGLPTDDPSATRAYLATLSFTTTARRSSVSCHGAGGLVDIDIYPERRSHLVNPADAARRGRIVARVVNAGTAPCADLHLSPGDTAYWWMGSHRGLPLTTDFWSIPPEGKIHHLAETGPTLTHSDSVRTSPDAKISLSPMHPPGDGGDLELVLFAHNSTWIACLGGCCESTTLTPAFY